LCVYEEKRRGEIEERVGRYLENHLRRKKDVAAMEMGKVKTGEKQE